MRYINVLLTLTLTFVRMTRAISAVAELFVFYEYVKEQLFSVAMMGVSLICA